MQSVFESLNIEVLGCRNGIYRLRRIGQGDGSVMFDGIGVLYCPRKLDQAKEVFFLVADWAGRSDEDIYSAIDRINTLGADVMVSNGATCIPLANNDETFGSFVEHQFVSRAEFGISDRVIAKMSSGDLILQN